MFGLVGAAKAFIVELYLLVFGLELFLQVSDIFLKVFFAFFVLALERENLVVSLGRHSLVRKAFCIGFARLLFELIDAGLHLHDTLLRKHNFVTHACDSHSQVFVITLDIVQQDLLVLELVLQRLQVSLLLLLRLCLLGCRIESVPITSFLISLLHALFRIVDTFKNHLVFIDFVFDFLLDLSKLLLHLLLIVSGYEQAFTLVLQLPRVVVRFLLQAHRLGLVKTVAGLHKLFIVSHHKCPLQFTNYFYLPKSN